jgi:hypothetical protein
LHELLDGTLPYVGRAVLAEPWARKAIRSPDAPPWVREPSGYRELEALATERALGFLERLCEGRDESHARFYRQIREDLRLTDSQSGAGELSAEEPPEKEPVSGETAAEDPELPAGLRRGSGRRRRRKPEEGDDG